MWSNRVNWPGWLNRTVGGFIMARRRQRALSPRRTASCHFSLYANHIVSASGEMAIKAGMRRRDTTTDLSTAARSPGRGTRQGPPQKHRTLTQLCFNAGPASQTLDQHWNRIGGISRGRWVLTTDRPIVGSMMAHRLRHWPGNDPTWGLCAACQVGKLP